ncbi:MAG: hypothetical protein ACK5ZA_02545 [Betaproteobacteria bacterium]
MLRALAAVIIIIVRLTIVDEWTRFWCHAALDRTRCSCICAVCARLLGRVDLWRRLRGRWRRACIQCSAGHLCRLLPRFVLGNGQPRFLFRQTVLFFRHEPFVATAVVDELGAIVRRHVRFHAKAGNGLFVVCRAAAFGVVFLGLSSFRLLGLFCLLRIGSRASACCLCSFLFFPLAFELRQNDGRLIDLAAGSDFVCRHRVVC